ncbi:hypothetical protein ElyMa_006316200 [Elysia marginata]|uniref:Uncharacterized protein n=1 Tax=Elysia marginata TaxID=1093978 RepID=A0AAV4HFR5_9GAST|nr:hypothetical protein ElyMa_006316200 [Elysia marginata]
MGAGNFPSRESAWVGGARARSIPVTARPASELIGWRGPRFLASRCGGKNGIAPGRPQPCCLVCSGGISSFRNSMADWCRQCRPLDSISEENLNVEVKVNV